MTALGMCSMELGRIESPVYAQVMRVPRVNKLRSRSSNSGASGGSSCSGSSSSRRVSLED